MQRRNVAPSRWTAQIALTALAVLLPRQTQAQVPNATQCTTLAQQLYKTANAVTPLSEAFEPTKIANYIADGRSLTLAESLTFETPPNSTFNGTQHADTSWAALLAATNATTTNTTLTGAGAEGTTDYDFQQVLGFSMLFYEAQRSGRLPSSNRIPWRFNSCLGDKAPNGASLVGGLYDAGDGLKLMFPLTSTTAILAWGLLEFPGGYAAAGQTAYALANIKWAADFLLACHIASNKYVAQVGTASLDHSNWTPPEEYTMARPVFVMDDSTPSADLLGGAAAGLAATSLVFRYSDPAYAHKCLQSAKDLYQWATQSEGKYSDYVPDQLYPSSGYLDDLSWGAAWLYKATWDPAYLSAALKYYQRNEASGGAHGYNVLNWDNVIWGVDLLLISTQRSAAGAGHFQYMERFLTAWKTGNNGIAYTPMGLATSGDWGTLRNTANAALLGLIYAKYAPDKNKGAAYACWAQGQLRYMLGAGPRSFVVGYGKNPPDHESHRGSSCPIPPASCGWNIFNQDTPNPNILYGGLVGGPTASDGFVDVRTDYQKNEVALDYNAGFSGALAALSEPSVPSWPLCLCILSGQVGCGPKAATLQQAQQVKHITPIKVTAPATKAPTKPAKAPVPAAKPGGIVNIKLIPLYNQCGGMYGNNQGADSPWPATTCAAGDKCTRGNQWYWQCLPSRGGTESFQTPTPAGQSSSTVQDTILDNGVRLLPIYQQCGGMLNCPYNGTACDAPWTGTTCPGLFSCFRTDEWFWNCLPTSTS